MRLLAAVGAVVVARVGASTPIDLCDDEAPLRGPPFWEGGRVAWSRPECLGEFLQRMVELDHGACPLHKSANLAPAGSGTTTLYQSLQHISPHAHHAHLYTVELVSRREGSPKLKSLPADPPPPNCFVITMREPAARLESGYRHAVLRRRNNVRKRPARTPARKNATAGWWNATALNEPIDAEIDAWRRHPDVGAGATFGGLGENGTLPRGMGVIQHQFFWPSAGYVHGARAFGAKRVHLLCTDRLRDDLKRFARDAWSMPNFSVHTSFGRSERMPGDASHISSPAMRHWVNYYAYPADTALWRLACAEDATNRTLLAVRIADDVLRERERRAADEADPETPRPTTPQTTRLGATTPPSTTTLGPPAGAAARLSGSVGPGGTAPRSISKKNQRASGTAA